MTVFTAMFATLCVVTLPQQVLAISNQGVIDLTNTQRAANGLGPLAWNAQLSNSALLKAQDMCNKNYWAHTSPDGLTAWTFMSQSGYAYTTAGENIANGFSDDSALMVAWMASPEHRANILGSAYQDIGVANTSCSLLGSLTTLVVAHYGARRAVAPAPAAAPITQPSHSAPAPVEAEAPPVPTTPEVVKPEPAPKPTESFGSKIWAMTQQHTSTTDLFQ